MIDRLPYQLSKGVTATFDGILLDDGIRVTKDGLVEDDSVKNGIYESIFPFVDGVSTAYLKTMISWYEAWELLRYREGDPWCRPHLGDYQKIIAEPRSVSVEEVYSFFIGDFKREPLHRIASILCDDAEAFRVLHWCVENLNERFEWQAMSVK